MKPFHLGGRQEGKFLSKISPVSFVSLIFTRDNLLEKDPRNMLGKTEGAKGRDKDG